MAIVVEDYHKNYGETVAVAGITFRVEPGEVLGLVGPNGAGKTTTLRALAGILRPTRGRLAIAGHDLETEPVAAKAVLAYVPDDPKLFDHLTVWEHFKFIASAYRLHDWTNRAELLLAQFGANGNNHFVAIRASSLTATSHTQQRAVRAV